MQMNWEKCAVRVFLRLLNAEKEQRRECKSLLKIRTKKEDSVVHANLDYSQTLRVFCIAFALHTHTTYIQRRGSKSKMNIY